MIRVLVAARSDSLERALEHSVRSSASLTFAGAGDPDRLPVDLAADVLLLEAAEGNGYDWDGLADLPIPIVLLVESGSALAEQALRSGIRGVLSPDATQQEIESAANAVIAGLVVVTPAAITDVLPERSVLDDGPAEPLSTRELEVLDQMAEGLSNKLIAHRLNISEHTVKTHIASIFAKLGVSSRTEAVSQAVRRGLVML